MPRRQFSNGDILFAEDINIIGYPVSTGEDVLGAGPKVDDNSLSDDPNNLKTRFYAWFNRFRVTLGTGLSVNVASGLVNAGGNIINIPPQLFTISDNSTVFLWIGSTSDSSSIQLRESLTLPDNAIPLAKVTTSAGTITAITDLREVAADIVPPSIPDAVPVGTSIFSLLPPSASVPLGYLELLENPRNVSRAIYADLFAEFGTYYGAGDGLTTFGLPGTQGRYPRLLNSSLTPGSIGGSNQIVVSDTNLPPHKHAIVDKLHSHGVNDLGHNHGVNDPGHNHGVNDPGHAHGLPGDVYDRDASEGSDGDGSAFAPRGALTYIAGSNISVNPSASNISIQNRSTGVTLNNSGTGITETQNTGNGQAIVHTQPYLAFRVFVKY